MVKIPLKDLHDKLKQNGLEGICQNGWQIFKVAVGHHQRMRPKWSSVRTRTQES